MKRKIKVNPTARIAYIPKELIDQGLYGELDGYANAVTLTIVNPNTPLVNIRKSLEIVLEDIKFRERLEKGESNESQKSPRLAAEGSGERKGK